MKQLYTGKNAPRSKIFFLNLKVPGILDGRVVKVAKVAKVEPYAAHRLQDVHILRSKDYLENLLHHIIRIERFF